MVYTLSYLESGDLGYSPLYTFYNLKDSDNRTILNTDL